MSEQSEIAAAVAVIRRVFAAHVGWDGGSRFVTSVQHGPSWTVIRVDERIPGIGHSSYLGFIDVYPSGRFNTSSPAIERVLAGLGGHAR